MKKLFWVASALLAVLTAPNVRAGEIIDAGARAFWGADVNGNPADNSDLIGDSIYEIEGATIVRVGSVLTLTIFTNFAGHAGVAPATTTDGKGVGYGDVFLKNVWNPAGGGQHYSGDNAANSTLWSYGLGLGDNRWNNDGGQFTLYKLVGNSNAKNINNSESVMKNCSGCDYRSGQEVSVKATGNNVKNTGLTGNWSIIDDQQIKFTINVAGTDLMNFAGFAMHWGETNQNDVIEGFTAVPEPAGIALLMLGLGGMAFMRRRRAQR